jgi:hypothetical protein
MSQFKIKTTLIFDIGGIIYFEFIPEETTVNQTFYVQVLKRLTDAVKRKRRELWRGRSLILHRDNVLAHSSCRMLHFLVGKALSAMDYMPYSPDFVSS